MLQVWYKFLNEQGQIQERRKAKAKGEPPMKFGFLDASWRRIGISGNELKPSNQTIVVSEQAQGGVFGQNNPTGNVNKPPQDTKPQKAARPANQVGIKSPQRRVTKRNPSMVSSPKLNTKNMGRRKR